MQLILDTFIPEAVWSPQAAEHEFLRLELSLLVMDTSHSLHLAMGACRAPASAGASGQLVYLEPMSDTDHMGYNEGLQCVMGACCKQLRDAACHEGGAREVLSGALLRQGRLLKWLQRMEVLEPAAADDLLQLAGYLTPAGVQQNQLGSPFRQAAGSENPNTLPDQLQVSMDYLILMNECTHTRSPLPPRNEHHLSPPQQPACSMMARTIAACRSWRGWRRTALQRSSGLSRSLT
jgi:hypothetical protein